MEKYSNEFKEESKDIESHPDYFILSYPLWNHNIEKVVFMRRRLGTSVINVKTLQTSLCKQYKNLRYPSEQYFKNFKGSKTWDSQKDLIFQNLRKLQRFQKFIQVSKSQKIIMLTIEKYPNHPSRSFKRFIVVNCL